MSINWGNLEFDGPTPAEDWVAPSRAGLYAIYRKADPQGRPNVYTVIYFGESGNLSDRGFWRSHHRFGCWINQAGSTKNLFIGVHLMPASSEPQRKAAEGALLKEYDPVCNKQ